MASAIFTKVRGTWKFYGYFSREDALKHELEHLKELGTQFHVEKMQSLSVKAIDSTENSLNA